MSNLSLCCFVGKLGKCEKVLSTLVLFVGKFGESGRMRGGCVSKHLTIVLAAESNGVVLNSGVDTLAFMRIQNTTGPRLRCLLASAVFTRPSSVRFEHSPAAMQLHLPMYIVCV